MAKQKPEKPTKPAPPRRKAPPRPAAGKRARPALKEKPRPKEKKPRPAAGGATIHFICSECYEEFTLGVAAMGDALTCPECLHVGKTPQEDFLVTVNETRGRERKMLVLATVIAAVVGVAGLLLVTLLSPHNQGLVDILGSRDAAGYVVGGLLGLAFLAGLVLSIQYERNRWEVYF
jgi:hypothetical protein